MRKQIYSDKKMVKKLGRDCGFCGIREGRKLAVLFLLITVLAAAGCKRYRRAAAARHYVKRGRNEKRQCTADR